MGKMKEVCILRERHIEEHPEDKDKPDEFFFDLYLKIKERQTKKLIWNEERHTRCSSDQGSMSHLR